MTYSVEMEYALAAKWWGWNRLEAFREIPTEEQAELIAIYRVENQIQGVLDYRDRLKQRRAAKGK